MSRGEPSLRAATDRTQGDGRPEFRRRLKAAPPRENFEQLRPSVAVRVLLAADLVAASFYVAWWLQPGRSGTPILFGLLAAAEAFNLVHLLGLWWAMWATRVHPPPPARTRFSIDVLIPTLSEPLPILGRTIAAAVAMEGKHRTYVLDDAGNPAVEKLARRLGALYIARREHRGAKAGNINNALTRTTGQLIAVFDADHVPRADFITRVIGYFEDDGIAFVQTPQHYGNAPTNAVARGALQQQAVFYGPICRGKNGLDSAFCCGTNVLIRRSALEDVGGFDERSVVEDFVTSMRIHRRGWSSVYYPYILAEGLGPSTVRSYMRQQFRWARGSIGALFSLELFRPGFRLGQRMQYFLAASFYLIGLTTAIYITLPIVYAIGGWSAFSRDADTFVFFYGPYLVLSLATLRWGLGRRFRMDHVRYTFGSFAVYGAAAFTALLRIRSRFRVTEKGVGALRARPAVGSIVAIVAFVATAEAIVLGAWSQPLDARTMTTLSWAGINLAMLWGLVRPAVRELRGKTHELPAPRTSPSEILQLPENALPMPVREERGIDRRRAGAIVGAVTLSGLMLRLALIDAQSLRLDESLSLSQSSLGLGELWRYMLTTNVHLPLYHSILHFWVPIFGASEWALRLPSVLLGTASIPMLYLVGARLAGRRAATFAAVIGAAAPFWVWHSDEARMYPLVLFLTLLSTHRFLVAVELNSFSSWSMYALAMGVALYSHYFVMLIVPVHFLYLLIHRVPRRRVLAWLCAAAGTGALFAPWVVNLYLQRLQPAGIGSFAAGLHIPAPDYSFFGLLSALVAFFAVYLFGYHSLAVLSVLTAALAGAWPLAIMRNGVRSHDPSQASKRTGWFLLAWIAVPVGAVLGLNAWIDGLFVQKYLILVSPAIFLLAGMAVARAPFKGPIGVAVLFSALATTSIVQNVEPGNPLREDFRTAAAIVRRQMETGDPVLVMPRFNQTAFRYYFGAGGFDALLGPEETPDAVKGAIDDLAFAYPGRGLWVLTLYESAFDPDEEVPLYLERAFPRTHLFQIGARMELRRYSLPAG